MPVLDDAKWSFLKTQVRRHRNVRSMVNRCRMVLHHADGLGKKAVAAELGVHEHTVGKWRHRFVKDRLDGLSDQPRSGRPRTPADRRVAEVIERTLTTTPADVPLVAALSIRCRQTRQTGLSHATIRRISGAFRLQPHRGVQALQQPALRGQGERDWRVPSIVAGPHTGALCERKEPDPGP